MIKGEGEGPPRRRVLTDNERDLVEEHLWVAEKIAEKYWWLGPKIADGDVEAAARDGLMDAAPGFDPSRGPFARYAYWFVVNAILEAAKVRAPKLVAAARAALDAAGQWDDSAVDGAPEDAAEALEPLLAARCVGTATLCYSRRSGALSEEEERGVRLMEEILSGFSEVERLIVIRHYGEGIRWEDVAKEVGQPAATVKRRGRRLLAVLAERVLARGAGER